MFSAVTAFARQETSGHGGNNKSWLSEGPIYETHPYYYPRHSFKEITQQMPQLADLGIKTIYLMPIWERKDKSSNPILIYLINDYYKIDPAYGTAQELKELVNAAHKHNMKILFDLVTCCAPPGSVVYNNNWVYKISVDEFKKKAKELNWALKYEAKQGREYVYSGKHQALSRKDLYEFAGEIIGDRIVVRHFPFAGWGPAVDRANPEVVDYFTGVAQYYVKEYDIDGWRIDAPGGGWNPELFPGDQSAAKLLQSAKEAVIKIKPDAVFLSEPGMPKKVPAEAEYANLRRVLSSMVEGKITSREFINKIAKGIPVLGKTPAFLIESHDLPRINQEVPELAKALIVLISTLPGVPFIQSGQEIGAKNSWFHGASKKPEVDRPGGDYALREFYKKVFQIRGSHPVLKSGGGESISSIWKSGDNIYAYLRSSENESVIAAVNFLNREAVAMLDLSFLAKGAVLNDELNNERLVVEQPGNFRILVPAYGSRILVFKEAMNEK